MCLPKELGGMGFWNIAFFNTVLLAKQEWRLMMEPDSFLAILLKAKYFPCTDFINSSLGWNPSYSWKSIWAAKKAL